MLPFDVSLGGAPRGHDAAAHLAAWQAHRPLAGGSSLAPQLLESSTASNANAIHRELGPRRELALFNLRIDGKLRGVISSASRPRTSAMATQG